MSGFGGSWQRRTRADALHYPVFRQMMEDQLAAREAVSNMGPPKAIGEVRYLGTAASTPNAPIFGRRSTRPARISSSRS